MPKRQNVAVDSGDESTSSAVEKSRMTPGNVSTTENPPLSSALKDTMHGNVFQLKLLMIFLLRGIGAGIEFRLGTEMPGIGGKFDDLIFKFKKSDQTSESYRFLQAKHKQDEEKKITAADLLQDNEKDFSLPKYFRSYCRDIIKGTEGIPLENIEDCIICTNIGFDSDGELRKSGIELIRLEDYDQILTFDKMPSNNKTPSRYKLRKTDQLRKIMTGWSEVHLLAKTLLKNVTEGKQLALSSPIFKSYHVALVDENVIDKKEGKLCASFMKGDKSRFREILSEITFVHYLGKLKLKRDDTKRSRGDSRKKLTDFDEESLRKLLPKTQSMELDLCKFEEVYDELIAQKVIKGEGRASKKESFTDNFLHGINLSPEGLEFRGKLRNAVFIHYWKDLTIQLSIPFGKPNRKKISKTASDGRKIISSTPDENKSLKDYLVGDKEIGDFLDKLVLAVHTPNEVELDDILKREVSDRYNLNESDFQSDFILRKMLDWFKDEKSNFMTSEEGKYILDKGKKKLKSLRVTALSIDYQKQLKAALKFNDKAIEEMKKKLTQVLTAEKRIGRIASPLPKRTAVKVIAALEKLREENKKKKITNNTRILQEYFQQKDSYLVTSLSRLKKDRSKFKKTLKSDDSHNLLVVVCEDGPLTENDDEFYQKLVEMQKKRIIIISQDGAEVEDKLKFGDLSQKSKRALLEKQIYFQGTSQSVGDLIKRGDKTLDDLIENGDPEEVIDSNSIEEMIKKNTIKIRTCSSARFEPELYVERQLEHPWENSFYDELAESMECTTDELQKECTVDSQGYIKWLTAEDSHKKEIWKQMKIIMKEKESQNLRDSQLSKGIAIAEKDLINKENRKDQVFIISGIAGTGKSTILSNYYEIIKRDNPDVWVIRIDLVDYSKELAEFNFSGDDQSGLSGLIIKDYQFTAVAFFVKIFAKKSSLTRSLLTYRFQTDGRVVVMLDGFDEIGGELHEKVFQLIKAVKLTKFDALYITTRSHLKETLQDKCFQFSYNFKKFSQEDQVACLSKYWGSKPKMSQTKKGLIQLFADSLVVCLTETLSDRESDFIGIPLQCRMLAECFETQLQDALNKKPPNFDSLFNSIKENELDLASLYSLFMEKKLEIYRAEKVKADPHNREVNSSINEKMTKLEEYLRKLAITTIVSNANYVNVLLGQSIQQFRPKKEIREEEEICTNGGVRIGFLDKNDKGQVKFLHRTYAEYLFAKYLYAGFLPEDSENCNHLLESKSVRKMIFNKILVEGPYKGVRVFFNSMLEECVQSRDNIPSKIEEYYHCLNIAFMENNSNIFLFTCDCLDMKFSKELTGKFIRERVNDTSHGFYCMYHQNSKVFERFMSYYDNITDADATFRILKEFSLFLSHIDPEVNKEKTLKFVSLVVDFLDQRQEAFLQISQKDFKEKTAEKKLVVDFVHFQHFKKENFFHILLELLFSNQYYDSPLKKYLKLLHSVYYNNSMFEKCLVDTLESHFIDMSQETLDYILENLRILEKENKEKEILKEISHHILRRNTQLFKSVYKREETVEDDSLPINIQSLLVRDPRGMTHLHRATLCDDEKTVDRILETVRITYFSNEAEANNLGKEVLHKVIASDEKGDTPLYVAAACEHENLCKKILNFLKEMLSDDELRKYLTDPNGFLGDALWDTMKGKKIKMFRIILESVKKIFGQDFLIALLKAESIKYEGGNVSSACHDEMFFNIVFEVIVNGENGYDNLYDLLFQNWKSIEHARRIDNETFRKILSLNGLDDFIKRIFDTDAHKGMHFVVCQILDKFTTEQRKELFRILITENSDTKSYFARCWLDLKEEGNCKSSKEILKCISDNLGQSVVKELLVRNEYEVIKKAFYLLHDGYSNYIPSHVVSMFSFLTKKVVYDANIDSPPYLVDFMLSFLSNKEDEVINHMMIIVLQLIEKITKNSDQEDHNDATREILLFVFRRMKDGVKESDLRKFVNLICKRKRASTKSKEINIWIDFLGEMGGNYHTDIYKFLNCAFVKLGTSAIEKLVRKEAVTQILTTNHGCLFVDNLLRNFSENKREKIELEVLNNVPATIKTLIETKPKKARRFWANILRLEYVTKYADRDVLRQLIDIITQPYKPYPDSDRTTCVWSSYLSYSECWSKDVGKFLLCVSDNLDKNKVKELVLHSCQGDRQSAITSAASHLGKPLVDAMLAHLTEEDRQKIQRDHVDPVLKRASVSSDNDDIPEHQPSHSVRDTYNGHSQTEAQPKPNPASAVVKQRKQSIISCFSVHFYATHRADPIPTSKELQCQLQCYMSSPLSPSLSLLELDQPIRLPMARNDPIYQAVSLTTKASNCPVVLSHPL
ncbi:hypothetical protein DAPPUDRAFT_307146 [Daphnia pulex]|uniref:NACHT domain-containing protein n=1 Tax=Daphnia pulex TaxID=6669 RepID=E9FZM5_DAPPU|nr:hypothetical protein DAPPUDRAFT_307146 [Daphnia pulex]|eukprot:EFX87242.1 hypothetical protein DAPPUDRAFT_307146 [Daphnia pulex]